MLQLDWEIVLFVSSTNRFILFWSWNQLDIHVGCAYNELSLLRTDEWKTGYNAVSPMSHDWLLEMRVKKLLLHLDFFRRLQGTWIWTGSMGLAKLLKAKKGCL